MRVAIRRNAVRSPARMADPRAAGRHDANRGFEIAQLSLPLEHGDRAVAIEHGDARGVIAAILKSVKPPPRGWVRPD